MSWHYQLMKHTEHNGEVWYGIHELYDGIGYTIEPRTVRGEDIEDIKWVLETMLEDVEKHGVKDYV
tara:strand:+ start:5167 stop:5364 length:198 start_codon:yes stop_codon:yes gene_type:complete